MGASAEKLKRLAGLAFADPSHQPNPVAIESPAALEEALGALRAEPGFRRPGSVRIKEIRYYGRAGPLMKEGGPPSVFSSGPKTLWGNSSTK